MLHFHYANMANDTCRLALAEREKQASSATWMVPKL